MVVYHASFPSGHAMLSASVYLTLGTLLVRLQQRRFQAFLLAGSVEDTPESARQSGSAI
jgi:undecaprenyl-diphosphatase